jgi:NADP-dependent 3-hydroxy acid dehydrogenase YdfG
VRFLVSDSLPSSQSVAIVTGAGSGIGRAIALRFSRSSWTVVLVGRRAELLEETAALLPAAALVCPTDITDPAAVKHLIVRVTDSLGRIDALLYSAGANVARRNWMDLSLGDYRNVMATNLDGAFYCAHAVLPVMRRQGAGTIVMINSEAGRLASAKSGVPYVAAKFGMTGLAQTLNIEERGRGVRACSIFPGDVNTPLLDRRPQPPPPESRNKMLQPEDIAEAAWLAVSLPPRVIVEEVLMRPA